MTFGRYRILAFSVKYLRPDTRKGKVLNKKTGQWEYPKCAMIHRHIFFQVIKDDKGNPVADGFVFHFGRYRRNKWCDSRDSSQETCAKHKDAFTDLSLQAEIARFTSADNAQRVWTTMEEVELDKQEYADRIGAQVVPDAIITGEDGEEYERTVVKGGLLGIIEAQKAKSKSNHLLSKVMNRR